MHGGAVYIHRQLRRDATKKSARQNIAMSAGPWRQPVAVLSCRLMQLREREGVLREREEVQAYGLSGSTGGLATSRRFWTSSEEGSLPYPNLNLITHVALARGMSILSKQFIAQIKFQLPNSRATERQFAVSRSYDAGRYNITESLGFASPSLKVTMTPLVGATFARSSVPGNVTWRSLTAACGLPPETIWSRVETLGITELARYKGISPLSNTSNTSWHRMLTQLDLWET